MTIHVAVGVIVNAANQVLVTQRHLHADQGGLWEFPGGKVEANEAVYDALCRELKEEINLDVIAATPLIKVKHDYEKYSVFLDTWMVKQFRGQPQGAEGQNVRWVNVMELQQLTMPAANFPLVSYLTIT